MNVQEMMKQARKMQTQIQKIRDEAGNKTVEGTAGGGMVVVVANGHGQVQSVKIEREVVDPADPEMLQDLVMAATNQALARANELMQSELSAVTGGMPMPGMF